MKNGLIEDDEFCFKHVDFKASARYSRKEPNWILRFWSLEKKLCQKLQVLNLPTYSSLGNRHG
jgi:hypothetical protein